MYTKAHPARRRRSAAAAFSMVEVCVAALLFGIYATASVYAMVQFNRMASVARFRTIAQVAAQQKMDEISTVPWTTTGTRPAVLTTGTTTESAIPLNNDALNSAAGLVSIYTNEDVQVTATRTTTIGAVTGNTRLLKANVVVSFKYSGRDYSVSLTGLRATDNF